MPTSVGPKSKGKDNLVFGYDTGDTVNSYKGEPTENLVDAFPDTSLPSGFHLSYEFSASISDSPVSNHQFSDRKWVKFTKTKATNGRVMFTNGTYDSGSQYTWSCYVYCNDSRLTSLYHGSDNGAYSQRTSFKQYDFNKLGTVQRLYGTWNQLQTAGSVFGMRAGSSNPLSSSFFMTGLQVEEKGHMTPVIDGTRSADSGSLIDLTGNSTIDLTNVSFDSDAQVDFDGSNDYGEISDSTLFDFGTSDFSMEAVIKGTGTSNYRTIFYHFYNPGFVYITMINTGVMRVWIHNKVLNGNTNILDGKYHHTAFVRQGDTLTFYVDGVEDATSTGWTSKNATNTSKGASIGRYIDGSTAYPFDGAINVLNAYNRALTASEIKANFNAIKGRFNIE